MEKETLASQKNKTIKNTNEKSVPKKVTKTKKVPKKTERKTKKTAAKKTTAKKTSSKTTPKTRSNTKKASDINKVSDKKILLEKRSADEKAVTKKQLEEKKTVFEKKTEIAATDILMTASSSHDPSKKNMIIVIAGVILLIASIITASNFNKNKYYIKTSNGAVEIWKGSFAPIGMELMMTLPGAQMPEAIKDFYSKDDVYPFISKYYVEKSEALLNVPGMPHFEGIKSDLNKALAYATTKQLKNIAQSRLDSIDFMVLFYKAEVAASQGDIAHLEAAKNYLKQAAQLNLDQYKTEMVEKKIGLINNRIAALKERPTVSSDN